jgi:hypothetical protein
MRELEGRACNGKQHMSSNGKSDVTGHAHARAEVQVSQDEEPAKGKQRRRKKAKTDRGNGSLLRPMPERSLGLWLGVPRSAKDLLGLSPKCPNA